MAQPKPTPEPEAVPKALQPLVEELAKLRPSDRELVIRAAEVRSRYPAVSWDLLDAGRGIVSFGGNAVEDCEALYDG